MSERTKQLDYFLLLVLGAVFLFFQSLQFNYDPIGDAQILALQNSLKYYRVLLSSPGHLGQVFSEFPPLIYLFSSAVYALCGFSLPAASLSSLCFIFLLLFALYGLGRYYGGRTLAWILIFLTLANPRTLFWSKFYTLNFPEMAVFALTFYLLVISEDFTRFKPSALFGLFFGLGILTRYPQVFLLLPLLWTFLVLSRRELPRWKKSWGYWGIILGWVILLKGGGGLIYRSGLAEWFKNHFYLCQGMALLVLIFLWLYWKKKSSSLSPLGNFTLAVSSGLLLSLPWQFATQDLYVPYLATYFKTYFPDPESFWHTARIFLIYAAYNFPGAGAALLLGLIYSFWRGKCRAFQLLAIAGLGGIVMMALLIVDPAYRYFLTLLPVITLLAIVWLNPLPRIIKILALLLSGIWFLANLLGFNLLLSHQLNLYPRLLGYEEKLLSLTHYRGLSGDTVVNVEDLNYIGLERPALESLAGAIKREYPIAPKNGLNILFLNLVPGLMFHNGQLEIELIGQGYFPGGRFSLSGLKEQWIFLKEFQASSPAKLPLGYREKLEHLKTCRLEPPPDFLLIAAPGSGGIKTAEAQVKAKGYRIKPLYRETFSRSTFRQVFPYQLNFYRTEGQN